MNREDIFKEILFDFVKEMPEGWFHDSIPLKEINHLIHVFLKNHGLLDEQEEKNG